MSDNSATTWLTDGSGARIGIQVVQTGAEPLVKLLLPDHGAEKTIDRSGASRLVEMLRTGLTVSEMLGESRFDVVIDEIPDAERGRTRES